ncbi:Peroxiredoxin-5 [Escovopsis weberi]|uniref:Peroxiredoxin-5 n=1 Tax=Escovopsis weberi TaxID=150374 RepID=A0A0M9VSH3_ESCWE|nr:Peroxiredoxin-5 [Escovopsis weberi]
MAFRAAFRRAALARPVPARGFHSTPRALVKAGDEIPRVDNLFEKSAANKVDLAAEFGRADGYLIGVPGAFSGTCSAQHVPSWIDHPRRREAGQLFVVAVNDPFVMKAWADQLDPAGETGIRFIADPTAALTKALGLGFEELTFLFGGTRMKRCALKIENGKVTKAFVEPDNTGADVSMAENVLA